MVQALTVLLWLLLSIRLGNAVISTKNETAIDEAVKIPKTSGFDSALTLPEFDFLQNNQEQINLLLERYYSESKTTSQSITITRWTTTTRLSTATVTRTFLVETVTGEQSSVTPGPRHVELRDLIEDARRGPSRTVFTYRRTTITRIKTA